MSGKDEFGAHGLPGYARIPAVTSVEMDRASTCYGDGALKGSPTVRVRGKRSANTRVCGCIPMQSSHVEVDETFVVFESRGKQFVHLDVLGWGTDLMNPAVRADCDVARRRWVDGYMPSGWTDNGITHSVAQLRYVPEDDDGTSGMIDVVFKSDASANPVVVRLYDVPRKFDVTGVADQDRLFAKTLVVQQHRLDTPPVEPVVRKPPPPAKPVVRGPPPTPREVLDMMRF